LLGTTRNKPFGDRTRDGAVTVPRTARRLPWAGHSILERRWDGSYLAFFTACSRSDCPSFDLFVFATADGGATWPWWYRAGGRPTCYKLPLGITWDGRVMTTNLRLTERGSVQDAFAQDADDFTPPPSPTSRRKRRA
jgi:hypothetical protein